MAEGKPHGRVALALVCGLAMCCAVMYVTADGEEAIHYSGPGGPRLTTTDHHSEMAQTTELGHTSLSSANIAHATATGKEIKVESWDVKKVSTIWTDDTPADGTVKLVDYFKKVETEIASEVAGRKENIAQIRTKMATNRAINMKARHRMKKMLLARMAVNAKVAKDALNHEMRITAANFHKAAVVENKRAAVNRKEFKKTRELMRKNKKESRHALRMATLNQQRALATLDAATNAKIRKTNQHIAANAAQITENARVARKNLDHAVDNFSKLMYRTQTTAKMERSKLAATAASMDKKFRADVANKVREATASAAEEFRQVRKTMADDRHKADMALAASNTQLTAALNAAAATQDAHFATTVADIKAAREEADKRVKAASASFKMNILATTAIIAQQTAKLNQRQQALAATVQSNALEQADIDNKVNAELKRINKVGEEREENLLKANSDLDKLMKKNRADTKKKKDQMQHEFTTALAKIKNQMAKDRKYNEQRLAKATGALSATMKSNQAAQDKVNAELTAATKQMAADAKSELNEARASFTSRLGALSSTVKKNDKKADADIAKLTGVEAANAMKSKEGRRLLKLQSDANRKEMTGSINAAVAKGEKRANQIEGAAKKMNKKTLDAMNLRISTEIGTLTKSIHADIEELQFATKKARAQMKAEIVAALREEEKILSDNLLATIKWAKKEVTALDGKLAAEEAKGSAARGALRGEIADDKHEAMTAIKDAMAAQARSLIALKAETDIKIKKTNTDVAAYGKAIEAQAKSVAATMKANRDTLVAKLNSAKVATVAQLGSANAASIVREKAALTAVSNGIKAATAAADIKFGEAYKAMGVNREHAAEALAGAVSTFNEALAAQSALQEKQFATTVTNLAAAKAKAAADVVAARKAFTMGLVDVKAQVKASETKILGEIQVVATMLVDDKAEQARVNSHMNAEIKRTMKLADKHSSANQRARGQIGKLMNENKVYAAEQTKALGASADLAIEALDTKMAKDRASIAEDLKEATAGLFEQLHADKMQQGKAISKMEAELTMRKASTAATLAKAKAEFEVKQGVLTNSIVANHEAYERGINKVTKVAHNWNKSAASDRVLIREERSAMNANLNKEIGNAIQRGEARAKEVLDRSSANIDKWKAATTVEIGERVERMADAVYQSFNTNRKTIANNYLSVKGYAGAAQDKIIDYVQKGETNLLSIGDFMQSVAMVAKNKVKAQEGVSAGAGSMKTPFEGGLVMDVKGMNDINGLTNEFMQVYNGVRARWPHGLGKYLLVKLADSMAKGGILEVGKARGHEGQWVYINGKALGLSNKVGEFAKVGARINHYQRFLLTLSKHLPAVKHHAAALTVAPPEWQGN